MSRRCVRYLLAAPTYCKNSTVKVTGPGSIVGTFLLTDAKLRGSACRELGEHDVGRGFSGELDMALHWTHVRELDPLPPKPLTALQQMGQNGFEDDLKMGNKEELRAFMESLPVRLTIERIDAHKLVVELSDLFSGLKMEGDAENMEQKVTIGHVKFTPFVNVTFFAFFEGFVKEAIGIVGAKPTALLSATDKIVNSLLTQMGKSIKKMFGFGGKAVAPKVQAMGEAMRPEKLVGPAFSATGNFLKRTTSGLGKGLAGAGAGLASAGTGLVGAGGQLVDNAIVAPVGKVGEAVGELGGNIGKGVDAIGEGIQGSVDGLGKGIQGGVDELGKGVDGLGKGIGAGVDAIGEGIQGSVDGLGKGIQGGVDGLVKGTSGLIDVFGSAVGLGSPKSLEDKPTGGDSSAPTSPKKVLSPIPHMQ